MAGTTLHELALARTRRPDFMLASEAGADGATVVVGGEVDLATSPDLERALRGHATASRLTVDLTAVTFMDSSTMAALVGLTRRAREADQELVLRRPADRSVVRMLEIAGLLQMLPFAAATTSQQP